MKFPTVIATTTIVLLALQYSEAHFLNLGILDNIGNRLENIRDKIKERIDQQWRPQLSQTSEKPPTTTSAEVLPDFHFPEEVANETAEVTTVMPEVTTKEDRRIIEVPLINGGCPEGYRRVGNRCREVFAGRRRRRR